MRAAHPLRPVSQEEEQALQRTVKATSERVDVVKRVQAILAVKAGKPYTQAAREAGYKSGDSISQLAERFNQRGLAALLIAPGRGRSETSTPEQRERIVQELRRVPDREQGQSFAKPKEIEQATRVAMAQLNRHAKPWVWGRPPKDPRHYRRLFCYRI